LILSGRGLRSQKPLPADYLELTIGDLLEEPFEVNILREVLSIEDSGSENRFEKTGLSSAD
jgi:hypothetical protein